VTQTPKYGEAMKKLLKTIVLLPMYPLIAFSMRAGNQCGCFDDRPAPEGYQSGCLRRAKAMLAWRNC
jgi:hypothetical protein